MINVRFFPPSPCPFCALPLKNGGHVREPIAKSSRRTVPHRGIAILTLRMIRLARHGHPKRRLLRSRRVQRDLRRCSGNLASCSAVHGTGVRSGHATSIQFSCVTGLRCMRKSRKWDRAASASPSLPIPLRWLYSAGHRVDMVPNLANVYVTGTVVVPRARYRRLVRRSLELGRK